jgi:hypothetical protein
MGSMQMAFQRDGNIVKILPADFTPVSREGALVIQTNSRLTPDLIQDWPDKAALLVDGSQVKGWNPCHPPTNLEEMRGGSTVSMTMDLVMVVKGSPDAG